MSEQKYEGSMDNSSPTHSAPACRYLTDLHPQPRSFFLIPPPSEETPGATCLPKDTDSVFLKPQLRPKRAETDTLLPQWEIQKKSKDRTYTLLDSGTCSLEAHPVDALLLKGI